MFEIAGAIVIAAIILFALYFALHLWLNRRAMPEIGKGLREGFRGFMDGMKGVKPDE